MAVKIYNKMKLKGQKCSEFDPITGVSRMSDQLKSTYKEIAVWEKVAHRNIVKIFELFDSSEVNEMYLLMEHCKQG